VGSSGVAAYRYDSGSNSWTSASNGLPSSGTADLTQFGDLDGDGWLDIVVYDDPKGYVFLGDGSGNWTYDTTWTMPNPADAAALRVDGDIDHDGREDIAVLAEGSGFPVHHNQLRVYSPWLTPTQLQARVTGPHGGETFRSGSIRFIRWVAAVPIIQGQAQVEIQLSQNGASGPFQTIASGLPNNGHYQWLVNGFGSTTNRIQVVVSTATETVSALSPQDFTIIGDPQSLSADTYTLPGSTGGSVVFALSAGAGYANRSYLLLGSVSGTSPGTDLPGGLVTIPLNRDAFTNFVLANLNTSLFQDFSGSLDGSGHALATLTAPPIPAWIGTTAYFAFATVTPWDFASNAVAIEVVP
jgi:hypothetical protein